MLQYPILVRGINNLSDARYCAGMGVDYISFYFDTRMQSIEPPVAEGIAGWLSGVKFLGEYVEYPKEYPFFVSGVVFSQLGNESFDENMEVFFEYNLANEYLEISDKIKNLIISFEDNSAIKDNKQLLEVLSKKHQLWLASGFDKENIHALKQNYPIHGFCIYGGHEISPGLKTFEDLAEILEAIEVDN
jgi:phosphoribosylanthranilate isomerase